MDICSFSQYNELFSAEIGDEILHEVLRRLSRPFGSYLYRINGDVFWASPCLGKGRLLLPTGCKSLFAEPVVAGALSFTLQVRISRLYVSGTRQNAQRAAGPHQSALRFAKESDRVVTVYNGQLDEMIHTEADILRRLKGGHSGRDAGGLVPADYAAL